MIYDEDKQSTHQDREIFKN